LERRKLDLLKEINNKGGKGRDATGTRKRRKKGGKTISSACACLWKKKKETLKSQRSERREAK